MAEPLVSIIIPAYNGEAYLRETVESARAQTYANLEIVIVNDGSTDGTPQLAEALATEDPRIKVVHQENKGLSAARNSGILNATGRYINFLDADDWLLPHKIATQVEALDAQPEYGLTYSDFDRRIEGVDFLNRTGQPPIPIREILVYRSWFAPMVPLVRRDLIEKVGLFDTEFRTTEDRDYWYRCSLEGRFLYLPGVVATYRVHSGQMSGNRKKMDEGHAQFAAKHFASDRKRYRSCWAYYHLAKARLSKASGHYLEMVKHLFSYVTTANSVNEVRLIWRLSR